MESVVEELTVIINDVKKLLEDKTNDLSTKNTIDSKNQMLLNNLSKKIDALEEYVKEINRLNSSNSSLLINFRKRAANIKNEIELLN